MPTTLEAEGLARSWGDRRIFSGISLTAERGLIGITGENGSGKTTLLKILASLLRPDSGTVKVRSGGQDLSGDARRRAIGWAGPDLTFYDELSAEENLAFFRAAAGWRTPGSEIRERLSRVGLAPASGRAVGAFSTGMKQRLRMAFATLFDSPILLLDEPMIGLDAEGRAIVSRIVQEARRAGAVLLASNDPRDFEGADHTLSLPGAAA
ncbi:MAG: ABC transporter ATP-binding protein [Acidobacteriota bacterium]|nr:ABC transporter ATP-binding protein [Acidobacteriota bacterium]